MTDANANDVGNGFYEVSVPGSIRERTIVMAKDEREAIEKTRKLIAMKLNHVKAKTLSGEDDAKLNIQNVRQGSKASDFTGGE